MTTHKAQTLFGLLVSWFMEKERVTVVDVSNIQSSPVSVSHNVSADVFISTWTLSESSVFSQNYVLKRKWFDAKHLLIGYHENTPTLPASEHVAAIAKQSGAKIETIDFVPGNFYAFK